MDEQIFKPDFLQPLLTTACIIGPALLGYLAGFKSRNFKPDSTLLIDCITIAGVGAVVLTETLSGSLGSLTSNSILGGVSLILAAHVGSNSNQP